MARQVIAEGRDSLETRWYNGGKRGQANDLKVRRAGPAGGNQGAVGPSVQLNYLFFPSRVRSPGGNRASGRAS
ncbi:hypothetical protein ES703_27358 [subsurface metagenome]